MNDMLKKLFSHYTDKLKKDKKSILLILLGVVGMLLISFSEFTPREKAFETEMSEQLMVGTDIKRELEEVIGEIAGVGRVKVMITYECSKESIYAKDVSEQQNDSSISKDTEYILLESGSDESGLILKEIYPKVCGVAVVCDGGNDPVLKNEIISVIKSLFDINSCNISIAKMRN